jgi:hypothetical protein
VVKDDLTHTGTCPSTTFHLRWDGFTLNREYPGLVVCDECDWSAPIEWIGYRCKRCNGPLRSQRRGARYCSDACRQGAYRERKESA